MASSTPPPSIVRNLQTHEVKRRYLLRRSLRRNIYSRTIAKHVLVPNKQDDNGIDVAKVEATGLKQAESRANLRKVRLIYIGGSRIVPIWRKAEGAGFRGCA